MGVLGTDAALQISAAHVATESLHDCLGQCITQICLEFGSSVPAAVQQSKWAPPVTCKGLDLPALAIAICGK